ncbi:MAG TPA: ferrochelatase [Gammaproteobacteria bacterium]|nr:ferrochelatase [Gammaproteobacteria bacterium]
MAATTAVLLTNLGTPDRLERGAVKEFLREFLSDPLVVRLPRAFWLPLLHGIILPLRSGRTLEAYSRVWREDGSPLLAYANRQRAALQDLLLERAHVELAMRYGNPSYPSVLRPLRDAGVGRLVVLPLYPQYSVTTTATSYKHLLATLGELDWHPEIEFIGYYPDHPAYIEALAQSVRDHWRDGQRHLLMSFHGLPQANVERGDPYQRQCEQTARRLAKELGLDDGDWSIGYQSRFGRQTWIQPYTSDVLHGLVARGVRAVDVICPGFSADCLETLDEIEVEYRNEFLGLGGEEFAYIHALNERDAHIEMMFELVQPYLSKDPGMHPV